MVSSSLIHCRSLGESADKPAHSREKAGNDVFVARFVMLLVKN
jgi:hypothetical protein